MPPRTRLSAMCSLILDQSQPIRSHRNNQRTNHVDGGNFAFLSSGKFFLITSGFALVKSVQSLLSKSNCAVNSNQSRVAFPIFCSCHKLCTSYVSWTFGVRDVWRQGLFEIDNFVSHWNWVVHPLRIGKLEDADFHKVGDFLLLRLFGS